MKASTNISLLATASWLMLLAPRGAAKQLRRRQAERSLQPEGELQPYVWLAPAHEPLPTWLAPTQEPVPNDYLEDSTIDADKKGNKGSKYTPSGEDTSVFIAAWDELVYAYAAENYDGNINLLDTRGWRDLVGLWSYQLDASKQPPRSREESIAAQEKLQDSTIGVDKKSNKGTKYTPNDEVTSVFIAAWDEMVYAYAAENYDGNINLLDTRGWRDLVDLWSDQLDASKQPPRSREETIAAQEYYRPRPPPSGTTPPPPSPPPKVILPETEKEPSPPSKTTDTGKSDTLTFAVDIRRMNADSQADSGEVGNRVHNGMYYQFAQYDFTAAEGTMPFVIDSVSDHTSKATDGALHIKPRPNSLPYGQFGVGIGTHDPQYDLHVAGITEIEGDLIVKGRIFYYDVDPKRLKNKKKGETYENTVLPNRNRFDEDDEEDVIPLEGSALETQLLDLQAKYQDLESTVQQLMQRIDILEGRD